MKNVAPEQLALLSQLEEFRKRHESKSEPSDWAIRMCQAIVAHTRTTFIGDVSSKRWITWKPCQHWRSLLYCGSADRWEPY